MESTRILSRPTRWLAAVAAIGLGVAGCDVAGQPEEKPATQSPSTTAAGAAEMPPTENAKPDAADGKYNPLSADEARVILHKGTEAPFLGEYTDTTEPGTYACRRCNAPLYRSEDKFSSHCGWPSCRRRHCPNSSPWSHFRHRSPCWLRDFRWRPGRRCWSRCWPSRHCHWSSCCRSCSDH